MKRYAMLVCIGLVALVGRTAHATWVAEAEEPNDRVGSDPVVEVDPGGRFDVRAEAYPNLAPPTATSDTSVYLPLNSNTRLPKDTGKAHVTWIRRWRWDPGNPPQPIPTSVVKRSYSYSGYIEPRLQFTPQGTDTFATAKVVCKWVPGNPEGVGSSFERTATTADPAPGIRNLGTTNSPYGETAAPDGNGRVIATTTVRVESAGDCSTINSPNGMAEAYSKLHTIKISEFYIQRTDNR